MQNNNPPPNIEVIAHSSSSNEQQQQQQSQQQSSPSKKVDPKKDEKNKEFVSEVEKANPLKFIYFSYVWRLIRSAHHAQKEGKTILSKNLISFPWSRRADVLSDQFESHLKQQKQKHPNKAVRLGVAIFSTIKWKIFVLILMQTLFIFCRILSAWLIKNLIDCYTIPEMNSEGWKWAGYLAACLLLAFHLEHHYNHIATYLPNHIQSALINLLYGKITRLATESIMKFSTGSLINLCTNGVNLFEQFGLFASNIFVGVVALIAGGALIWQYFGAYSLIALGYIVFWSPIQLVFILLSLRRRNATNAATAKRIKLTGETLEAIRLLKMYAWEMSFKEKIEALREVEIKMLKITAITNSTLRGLAFSTQVCATFLMFLAYSLNGHELVASHIFCAYFVIGALRLFSSYFFGLAMNFFVDAKILMTNINKVLDAPEISEKVFEKPKNVENSVEFEGFSAYWNAEGPSAAAASGSVVEVNPQYSTIKDVTLNVKKGSLTALVGAVGAGKTTFLMSFTGEIPKTEGSLRYAGNIAYVEQEPTIFADTFRENITFGKPFEPEFYTKVIKACNLESDLKLFPQGDLSEIGEKGNNLSGGQKARLALARAVYSQADIYLLDDPLSAVDPKVARSIYNNAIEGILKDKTVFLTTHQVDFARSCENIILMEKGKVLGKGTYEELKQQGIDVDKVFGQAQKKTVQDCEFEDIKEVQKIAQEAQDDDGNQEGADDKKVRKDQFTTTVNWKTYFGLFKEMGSIWFFIALFLVYLTCEFSNMGYGRVLGAWLDGTFDEWITITILACFVVYDIVIYFVKFQMLGFALIKTAKSYHQKILDKVIRGVVFFFDTNPVGQILNRFSSDIGVLDRYIPVAVMDLCNLSFTIGSIVVTSSIINPRIIGPFALLAICIILLFIYSFPAIKQSKLYEIRSKGPLFGLLSSTLSGIVIVRVYKQADAFKSKFRDLIQTQVKANVAFVLASRFLAFYVDLFYNFTCIGCVFIITSTAQGVSPSEGTLLAFALVLCLSVNGILQHVLRQFSQINISMAAIARIQAYLQVPEEPPLTLATDGHLQKTSWPLLGEIQFENVYMKYRPDGEHVLKDLNIHVKPGMKIGCVGRTGAGKSTITQLLYRMQDIDKTAAPHAKDGFIKIDNTSTNEVGLNLLRTNISIIPQVPIIFSGTIRLNVDPLGQFSDEEIWTALEDVRLKEHVQKQPKGLDTVIHDGASVFSAGQKQLVCLARAILKKANILIMDEATANMDYDTDHFVQQKIAQRFAHATQFTIAHRLQTIAGYDKVLVLDKGRKVEFDEPYLLLVKNIGDEELTNTDGYFSIMVQNTGPISSKKIFEIAREAYFERQNKLHQQEEGREEEEGEGEQSKLKLGSV